MKKTIKKSVLKENYYYEFKPLYDTLPEKLTVPSYHTEILPKNMTHKEILETYHITPSKNIETAFAMIADCIPTLKNDYKARIAYFLDENGIPCRLDVWRDDDGELYLDVFKVYPGNERDAGDGVLVSENMVQSENEENNIKREECFEITCKRCGLSISIKN